MRLQALTLTLLTVGPAWAEAPRPRGETVEDIRARELAAALDDVTAKREGACARLHDAVSLYWAPEDRREWPRVIRHPIPKALGGWRPAADACAELAVTAGDDTRWSVSLLLDSPLLQKEATRRRAIEREASSDAGFVGLRVKFVNGRAVDIPRPAEPTLSPAGVVGHLDPESVRKVIHLNRGQIRWCYELRLMDMVKIEGRVLTRFVISPEGKAGQATLEESTLNDATVEACMLARIPTWTFPKPKDGKEVVVTYPFLLEPRR